VPSTTTAAPPIAAMATAAARGRPARTSAPPTAVAVTSAAMANTAKAMLPKP